MQYASDIAFTPAVKAIQTEKGSRASYAKVEQSQGWYTKVTPDLAREVLRDVFTVRKGQPSMDEIVRAVTERFGVKITDLQSRKRTNAVAYPRQIAMYLARKVTRHSLEEIGGFFGGRDHSTVLYAVEKITTEIQRDPSSRDLVEDLLLQFQQR